MLLLAASCPEPARAAPLTPEQQKRYEEARSKLEKIRRETAWEQPYIAAQQAKDRKELVRPAPPGFKPGKAGKKHKLTLIPRKTLLRKGESFWYRFELQNLGRKNIQVNEEFFKDGFLGRKGRFHFKLKWPAGKWEKPSWFPPYYSTPSGGQICEFTELTTPGWNRMNEEQRQFEVKKLSLRRGLASNVKIDLAPGETLVSRGWQLSQSLKEAAEDTSCAEPYPPSTGVFREFIINRPLDKIGKYQIQLILEDMPSPPPTEAKLRRVEKELGLSRAYQLASDKDMAERLSLGLLRSNIVSFEVAP